MYKSADNHLEIDYSWSSSADLYKKLQKHHFKWVRSEDIWIQKLRLHKYILRTHETGPSGEWHEDIVIIEGIRT